MRIGIVSGFACGLSFWSRLQDEGNEVKVYIDKGTGRERSDLHAHIGEGIVTLEENYEELLTWVAGAVDSILVFDSSGLGGKAEEARERGLVVIGGGEFCDLLENDREFGFEIAEEAGCQLPPYKRYKTLSSAKRASKGIDHEVYFKTDRYLGGDATRGCNNGADLGDYVDEIRELGVTDHVACIVQDKIEGVALSIGRWWNGVSFVGPYEITIEHKALMNDDVGPSTGCSINVVWFQDECPLADAMGFENFTKAFRENNAPPGLYDVNSVVDEQGQPWFLEWTPRFGYDSEPTSFRLIENLSEWFAFIGLGSGVTNFSSELAFATRLSVEPYPWEWVAWDDKKTCVGVRVDEVDGLWPGNFIAYQLRLGKHGGYELASPEGIVGLSLAISDRLLNAAEEATEYAKELKKHVSGLQFRTDGFKALSSDAVKLKAAGIDIPLGLL